MTIVLYRDTRGFPKEELYGLTSQIRRAVSSIGANLAEGCGRGTDREMAQFTQIAMGSASELEYHLLLARDLGLFPAELHESHHAAICEVKKMLASLLKALKADR